MHFLGFFSFFRGIFSEEDQKKYPGPDLNRHGRLNSRRILSPLRLPISPPGQSFVPNCISCYNKQATFFRSSEETGRQKLFLILKLKILRFSQSMFSRRGAESNRRYRCCRPVHYHFATAPNKSYLFFFL
jgi:hypothetical protein